MINYDDSKHRYWDSGGDFISATTLIEHYCHKFDAEVQSVKTAAKRGGTPEQWKRLWAENGKYKRERGSTFHDLKEMEEGTRFMTRHQGRDVPVVNQGLVLQRAQEWDYYRDLPDGIYLELMWWHPGYRIAGRTDRSIIYTENGNRYLDIDDHKTNDKLPKESYRDRHGQYKMMLHPLTHIMDCPYWHYALQLSLYQLMGESMGFLPGRRRILHYGLTFDEQITGQRPTMGELLRRSPSVHETDYLKKEVVLMCEDNLKRIRP